MKFMVGERLGIDCGPPRPPALPLSPELETEIREEMAALGLERVST